MLKRVAAGVFIHRSDWMESNAVVVQGSTGVLVIDPGIHGSELISIADDLAERGQTVVGGFATHPHWDHLLWHERLGAAPRHSTALAAETARVRLAGGLDTKRLGVPDDVPLDLIGAVTGLPAGTATIPWDGPKIRIIEHQAHAPGHAALLVEDARVLVAGDMLSDVLIPLLDLQGTQDPLGDYLRALDLFDGLADEVDAVVPGHGSVADPAELRRRIDQDRAYIGALRDHREPRDPRFGPSARPGWEFVAGAHEWQVKNLK